MVSVILLSTSKKLLYLSGLDNENPTHLGLLLE
jgi:hypothetical protein